jgi:hypothetical protein
MVTRVRRWMRYRRELAGFVIDVLCELAKERATGRLTINFGQGCAQSAEFEERLRTSSNLSTDELEELAPDETVLDGPVYTMVEVVNPVAAKYEDDFKRIAQKVGYVARYLRSHPCVDCGNADTDVLQFDHVRGEKITEVSDIAYRTGTIRSLLEEIAKCEVRCANCHTKRHAVERREDPDRPHYRDHFLRRC